MKSYPILQYILNNSFKDVHLNVLVNKLNQDNKTYVNIKNYFSVIYGLVIIIFLM